MDPQRSGTSIPSPAVTLGKPSRSTRRWSSRRPRTEGSPSRRGNPATSGPRPELPPPAFGMPPPPLCRLLAHGPGDPPSRGWRSERGGGLANQGPAVPEEHRPREVERPSRAARLGTPYPRRESLADERPSIPRPRAALTTATLRTSGRRRGDRPAGRGGCEGACFRRSTSNIRISLCGPRPQSLGCQTFLTSTARAPQRALESSQGCGDNDCAKSYCRRNFLQRLLQNHAMFGSVSESVGLARVRYEPANERRGAPAGP